MQNATTIVAIVVAVVIMCWFPLMLSAGKKDDVTQMTVQKATTEFTNKARTTGKITREDYDNFIYTLSSTGESYDVNITVQRKDENYGKKPANDGGDTTIGDNVYLTEYDTQVMNDLDSRGVYLLNEGDNLKTEVENTSKTDATQLKSIFKINGKETGNITATASGIVTTTGKN